jgi:uncharacterized protein YjbI with pentapeptide repeats
MTITKEELEEILAKHKKWLNDEKGGTMAILSKLDLQNADLHNINLWGAFLIGADLSHANLHGVDLRNANLYGANLYGANLTRADLRNAVLQNANLQKTNLSDAELQNASLQGADLRGANIDYSCLPLHCGGLDFYTDERIATQLAYHFCSIRCDSEEFIILRNSMLNFANKFHYVGNDCPDCPKLTPIELPSHIQ